MGKKGSSKKSSNATSGHQMSVTIREASTGKKQTNVKSCLKLEHLKNLAVWASGEGAIPSLGAFFGHHLAASSEALGTPIDPSLFTCQRCESILQPGYNCTIRIEKNKTKSRRKGKKSAPYPQNNMVYTCHFCSHRNTMRGTPKGHMKAIRAPNNKPNTKSMPKILKTPAKVKTANLAAAASDTTKTDLADPTTASKGKMGIIEIDERVPDLTKMDSSASSPVTPSAGSTLTLLEGKKRKRKSSGAKKTAVAEILCTEKSANTSNRRRRKSWTSLKEIAESNEKDNSKTLMNLTVPFLIQ